MQFEPSGRKGRLKSGKYASASFGNRVKEKRGSESESRGKKPNLSAGHLLGYGEKGPLKKRNSSKVARKQRRERKIPFSFLWRSGIRIGGRTKNSRKFRLEDISSPRSLGVRGPRKETGSGGEQSEGEGKEKTIYNFSLKGEGRARRLSWKRKAAGKKDEGKVGGQSRGQAFDGNINKYRRIVFREEEKTFQHPLKKRKRTDERKKAGFDPSKKISFGPKQRRLLVEKKEAAAE